MSDENTNNSKYSVHDLVNAIVQGEPATAKDMYSGIITDKIAAVVQAKREDLARTAFGAVPQEEEPDDGESPEGDTENSS